MFLDGHLGFWGPPSLNFAWRLGFPEKVGPRHCSYRIWCLHHKVNVPPLISWAIWTLEVVGSDTSVELLGPLYEVPRCTGIRCPSKPCKSQWLDPGQLSESLVGLLNPV